MPCPPSIHSIPTEKLRSEITSGSAYAGDRRVGGLISLSIALFGDSVSPYYVFAHVPQSEAKLAWRLSHLTTDIYLLQNLMAPAALLHKGVKHGRETTVEGLADSALQILRKTSRLASGSRNEEGRHGAEGTGRGGIIRPEAKDDCGSHGLQPPLAECDKAELLERARLLERRRRERRDRRRRWRRRVELHKVGGDPPNCTEEECVVEVEVEVCVVEIVAVCVLLCVLVWWLVWWLGWWLAWWLVVVVIVFGGGGSGPSLPSTKEPGAVELANVEAATTDEVGEETFGEVDRVPDVAGRAVWLGASRGLRIGMKGRTSSTDVATALLPL
ncbi:hypothetical protein B0H19DRAFT_1072136 [Mycena capillaripes]|nr:hypothetical protein B0H19DRAFT_1072136 [Mycena capillaripes]